LRTPRHGYADGAIILIRGATQSEYNGVKTITFINANSYSYSVSGFANDPCNRDDLRVHNAGQRQQQRWHRTTQLKRQL
jgi:hypothetical protein